MGLTFPALERISLGNKWGVYGQLAFDSSYPTGGESLTPGSLGLSQIGQILVQDEQGYTFEYDYSNSKLKAFVGGTASGTNSAPTFTGTSPTSALNLATPAFSGTGLTAAGQVITTTSTHTMTLNQCAGMWLLSATGATPPNLILSNTAVTGAAAVLTVQGAASTDAGAYKIVKALTPVGTVSAPTFTGSVSAGSEVANATNLSVLSAVEFLAIGL